MGRKKKRQVKSKTLPQKQNTKKNIPLQSEPQTTVSVVDMQLQTEMPPENEKYFFNDFIKDLILILLLPLAIGNLDIDLPIWVILIAIIFFVTVYTVIKNKNVINKRFGSFLRMYTINIAGGLIGAIFGFSVNFFTDGAINRILWCIFYVPLTILTITGFFRELKNKKHFSKVKFFYSLFCITFLLSVTYLPNIGANIINPTMKSITGNAMFNEYIIDGRGLLGTYKETGYGNIVYSTGWIDEGYFINYNLEGYGKSTNTKTGFSLEGYFENGSLVNGKVTFSGGMTYEGELSKGAFDGYGILTLPSGSTYEGYFANDEFEGYGILTTDTFSHEGYFVNGRPDGHGKRINEEGEIYEGNFTNGILEGMGTLTLPNGDVREGEFVSGMLQGDVKIIYPSGEERIALFKFNEFIRWLDVECDICHP
jgi:hypothetical protein